MPTGTIQNGDLIGIYINQQLIANGKDCKLSLGVGARETTNKDDVGTYSGMPAKKTNTLQGSFLHAEDAMGFNQIYDIADARQLFTWKHGSVQPGQKYRYGTGFFTACDHGAGDNDNVTGSYSIQVTGKVFTATNP